MNVRLKKKKKKGEDAIGEQQAAGGEIRLTGDWMEE
jgi:hypothetical protein